MPAASAQPVVTEKLRPLTPTLLMQTGGRTCALPLGNVLEIMRPLETDTAQGAPRGVAGIALVRGHAVPVIDLGILLGSDAAVSKSGTRFVLLQVGTRCAALRVDKVISVREFALDQFEALPPLWRGAENPGVAALGALDHELLLLLDAARIIPLETEAGR
ncbi:MAG TPA: chemotaxis protein CheW [Phycisphaerae bacterium]|nr:chemotaxis protein CheW [Phycisphaerae bacterium]